MGQFNAQNTQFPTFRKWIELVKNLNSSNVIRRTFFGLYIYIPLGLVFLWIELKMIIEDSRGSSFPLPWWFIGAIFSLPFALMLVVVLDAAYQLAHNPKYSGIKKGYLSVFGILLLSLYTGLVAINGEKYGKEDSVLPMVIFGVWVIYNLLMFVNLYFAMKVIKKIRV